MAIHYFDVDDNGLVFHDDQGTDCPDFDFVKKEAISTLVDIVRETLPDGTSRCRLDVMQHRDGSLAD